MSTTNVGALVVTDGDKVVGMLTNRDIVNAFSRHGWRLSDLHVADILRPDFVSVAPDDNLKQVMALMTRRRATHMPVFEDNRLSGIISIGDVVKHRLEELELETDVDGDWYFYPEPIYPYPNYIDPNGVSGGYYCTNPQGYYPYVASCDAPWQSVPAVAPPP
jgi:predicted transcriptional regulator